jgi:hypothetical protein
VLEVKMAAISCGLDDFPYISFAPITLPTRSKEAAPPAPPPVASVDVPKPAAQPDGARVAAASTPPIEHATPPPPVLEPFRPLRPRQAVQPEVPHPALQPRLGAAPPVPFPRLQEIESSSEGQRTRSSRRTRGSGSADLGK